MQFLFLTITAFILFTTAPAMTDDKVVRMALSDRAWPPYEFVDQEGPTGIMADIMAEICAKAGWSLTLTVFEDKRREDVIILGEQDASPMAKAWTRDPDELAWTDPALDSTDVLVFLADRKFPYIGPQDLFGKRIGCVQAYIYPTLEPYFDNRDIIRHDTPNTFTMLKLLQLGRVDAAIVNKNVALWFMKNEPGLTAESFSFSQTPVATAAYGYMFNKSEKWTAFIRQFNIELAQMKADGRLDAILKKYR